MQSSTNRRNSRYPMRSSRTQAVQPQVSSAHVSERRSNERTRSYASDRNVSSISDGTRHTQEYVRMNLHGTANTTLHPHHRTHHSHINQHSATTINQPQVHHTYQYGSTYRPTHATNHLINRTIADMHVPYSNPPLNTASIFRSTTAHYPTFSMPIINEHTLRGTRAEIRFIKLNSFDDVKVLITPRKIYMENAIFHVNDVSQFLTDENYRVFLRFCKYSPSVTEQTDCLPKSFNLLINQTAFQVKNKYTFAPYDITTRITYEKNNEVTFKVQLEPNSPEVNENFLYALFLVRKVDHKKLIANFKQRPVTDLRFSADLVKKKVSPEDEDDGIAILGQENNIRVSLLCPLSATRIKIPARSKHCDHVNCFDAESFISLNDVTPRWKCPICKIYIKLDDMIIDGLFVNILRGCSPGISEADVFPDGSFEPVEDIKANITNKFNVDSNSNSTSVAQNTLKRKIQDAQSSSNGQPTRESPPSNGSTNKILRMAEIECITIDSDDDDDATCNSDTSISSNNTELQSPYASTVKDQDDDSDIEIVYEKIVPRNEKNDNNHGKTSHNSKGNESGTGTHSSTTNNKSNSNSYTLSASVREGSGNNSNSALHTYSNSSTSPYRSPASQCGAVNSEAYNNSQNCLSNNSAYIVSQYSQQLSNNVYGKNSFVSTSSTKSFVSMPTTNAFCNGLATSANVNGTSGYSMGPPPSGQSSSQLPSSQASIHRSQQHQQRQQTNSSAMFNSSPFSLTQPSNGSSSNARIMSSNYVSNFVDAYNTSNASLFNTSSSLTLDSMLADMPSIKSDQIDYESIINLNEFSNGPWNDFSLLSAANSASGNNHASSSNGAASILRHKQLRHAIQTQGLPSRLPRDLEITPVISDGRTVRSMLSNSLQFNPSPYQQQPD